MISNHSKLVLGLPAFATLCLLHAAASAETMEQIYAKAKLEKSLVLYAGGPVSNYEPLAREFEQKFPSLTVTITGGFSNVLNQKIEQQFSENKLEVDMVFLQTAQDFVRWNKQGRMLHFKPESFNAIDPSFRDKDGAFIVWYVGTLSYAYNTQALKPESVPKSALDFLKPEFRGKMIACYPHDDDATLYIFYTLMKKYGASYIEKYLANQPNWVQGHLGVSRSVAAGTDLVTIDATTSTVLNLKKAGQPIEYAFSKVDPIPVYYPPPASSRMRRIPMWPSLHELDFAARAAKPHRDIFSRTTPPPLPELKPLRSKLRTDTEFRNQQANSRLAQTVRNRIDG